MPKPSLICPAVLIQHQLVTDIHGPLASTTLARHHACWVTCSHQCDQCCLFRGEKDKEAEAAAEISSEEEQEEDLVWPRVDKHQQEGTETVEVNSVSFVTYISALLHTSITAWPDISQISCYFSRQKNVTKMHLSRVFFTLIVGILVMRAGISHEIITYLLF